MKTKKRIKRLKKDVNFLFDDLKAKRNVEKALNEWIRAINEHAHARMNLIEFKSKNGLR